MMRDFGDVVFQKDFELVVEDVDSVEIFGENILHFELLHHIKGHPEGLFFF